LKRWAIFKIPLGINEMPFGSGVKMRHRADLAPDQHSRPINLAIGSA
jgi:hypothetical protein